MDLLYEVAISGEQVNSRSKRAKSDDSTAPLPLAPARESD